ncbi:O-antigen ligase family protein [Microbacterium suwonense]|uniref:O-antigen ligase family protein n=1 Tax=Microbacterium suwonense TaxID=683047 RepID=UPI003608BD95
MALAFVCLSAFVFDPFGMDRWVFSKELVFVTGALLALCTPASGRLPRWWYWWLVGATGVLLIATLSSGAPLAQLLGRWPRYEGVISLGLYALAVAVGARLLGGSRSAVQTQRSGQRFLTLFAAALALTAFISVLESFGLRPISSDLLRPGSLLGNASDLGIMGVIGLGLFLPAFADAMAAAPRLHRITPLIGLLSAIVVVVTSASRGAMLGGAAVIVTLIGVGVFRRERTARWWAAVGAAAVAGLVLLLVSPFTLSRLAGSSEKSAGSAANRLELWSTTTSLIGGHPVAGVGANGYADAITAFLGDSWFATIGIGGWIESPHSVILQIATAGGLLGMLAVLAFAALAARHLRRQGVGGPFGIAGLLALLGAGVALCVHFTSPGTMIPLCLIAGATLSAPPAEEHRQRWTRIITVSLLGLWVVLLAMSVAADHRLSDGMAALSDGETAIAEREFRAASVLRFWDADLPLMVSESLAATAEHAGTAQAVPTAASWALEATTRLPASARALKAEAVIAQFSGRLQYGITALERAAELAPTDPQIFHRLGGLQFLNGAPQAALVSLERASALAPNDPDVRATLEYVRSSNAN